MDRGLAIGSATVAWLVAISAGVYALVRLPRDARLPTGYWIIGVVPKWVVAKSVAVPLYSAGCTGVLLAVVVGDGGWTAVAVLAVAAAAQVGAVAWASRSAGRAAIGS